MRDTDVLEQGHEAEGSAFDPRKSARWSSFQRVSFRFLCLFVLLAIAETYDPWIVLPAVGPPIATVLDTPLTKAAEWTAVHLFHISGIAATAHPTDSRETALGWITMLLIVVLSAIGAAAWGLLDRRRQNYAGAAVWMRYILRLTLIFIMFRYGIFKVFPLQMARPSLGVLNEPLGQSSPMTLLWTLIGLKPSYQIISGLLETACAVLLFFRRTALLGTLLGIVVMTNIVLLNFSFDVPVKLGALLILFAFVVLLSPDLPSLFIFFGKRLPSRIESEWRPEWKTHNARRAATALEIAYVPFSLYYLVPVTYQTARQESANRRAPSPLSGEWHLDSAKMAVNGKMVDAPVLTAEGVPMIALYLEPDGRVMARSQDGRLWRAGLTINVAQHSLSLYSGYFEGVRFNAEYAYTQDDSNHLRLDPVGDGKASESTLLLTRVPLPANYPLLQAHFHWVQEWALER